MDFASWYQNKHPIADIPFNYRKLFPDSRAKDGVAFMPIDDANDALEILGTDTLVFRVRGKQCLQYEIRVIKLSPKRYELIHTEKFALCQSNPNKYSSDCEGLFMVSSPPGIGGRDKVLLSSETGQVAFTWKYDKEKSQFSADLNPYLPEWVLKDTSTTTEVYIGRLLIDGTVHNDVQVIACWEYQHPVHDAIRIQLNGSLPRQ